jgi:hypothetical protein
LRVGLLISSSENSVMAKFTGMLIYPIAPVLSEVGLEKVTGTRSGSRARAAGGRRTTALSVAAVLRRQPRRAERLLLSCL